MTRELLVWWRDDDAGPDDPATNRFADFAKRMGLPVGVAVIPKLLDEETAEIVIACPHMTVLQHGFSHQNNGPPGGKKIELGGGIDRSVLIGQLRAGRERLEAAFGDRLVPIMVPPWNRIDPDVAELCARAGWTGLSTYGPRGETGPDRPYQINTHLDLVDWQGTGQQKPFDVLWQEWLALRDLGEPIGLLSHHLIMSNEDLDDFARLLRQIADDGQVRFGSVPHMLEGRR